MSLILMALALLVSFPLLAEDAVFPPDAIHKAAYKGDVEMVKRILATHPDPDARDEFGATALHDATFRDNMEVLKLLIDYGYDVNAVVPQNGFTPLHYCVWTDNLDAAKVLVAAKAKKDIKSKKGQTALQMASKAANRPMMLLLAGKKKPS